MSTAGIPSEDISETRQPIRYTVPTMIPKQVYAPGGMCGTCFAPGQIKITGQPAIGTGILARELGQPASQLAPGIQAQQQLNSPG